MSWNMSSLASRIVLLFVGLISVSFSFQLVSVQAQAQKGGPYFASGVKAGEVTHDSAIIWARLTDKPSADFKRLPIFTEGLPTNKKSGEKMPEDIVPGRNGGLALVYYPRDDEEDFEESDLKIVDERTDFIRQFKLKNLYPDTEYKYEVESTGIDGTVAETIVGRFKTAPRPNKSKKIRFIVSTCQAIRSIDSGAEGHLAYKQMLEFKPDFFVHTGDILYYDKTPLAKTVASARSKWNLMFSYGHNRKFHQNVSSYFMKDDHDTLKNDCWPGQTYGDLTFEEGLKIFREQVPMGDKTYRTYRWGKDVQIWMTENRDFRSNNRMKDGPGKTILGKEQKDWLKKTIAESDATFKFVISPGPLVGPDKKGKADNHSNSNFTHEGQELRDFLSKQKNTYVICGDRHWQYCSKDPKTGLIEFGCGPINDEHSFGGTSGLHENMHRFFGAKGGFFAVTIEGDNGKAEWFNTNAIDDETKRPKISHTETLPIK